MKSRFEMNYRFRNGIFLFCIFLFGYSVFLYFFKTTPNSNVYLTLDKAYQHHIDSLKCVAAQKNQLKFELKPFNPNFISDYKGYVLGLSPEHLKRLNEYRANDQWVNSVAEFKKITLVSDSLLVKIAPFFNFPSYNRQKDTSHGALSFEKKKELNTITYQELVTEFGIPDFIAKRILAYREKINGFVDDAQLQDVHGLYKKQKELILKRYTVKESPLKEKIILTEASIKDLMRVPYIDFETAIKISDYQKANGSIKDFKELEKIGNFHFEKIDKIALYLTIK